jgi:rSAM/selenodomain-associated transferase 1
LEEAAQFHGALVEDTLGRLTELPMVRYLACAPSTRDPFFEACAERFGTRLVAQGTGDLGQRMQRVATLLLTRYRKVLLIGTDSPTLPLDFVIQAEQRLETSDLVFGPSEDGGYYLLGQRRLYREIFDGVTWGGGDVLAGTLAKLDPSVVAIIPPWYDVDRPSDLLRLDADLDRAECPRTAAWLRNWRLSVGRS